MLPFSGSGPFMDELWALCPLMHEEFQILIWVVVNIVVPFLCTPIIRCRTITILTTIYTPHDNTMRVHYD